MSRKPANDEWVDVPEQQSDDWVDASDDTIDSSVFIDPSLSFPGAGRTRVKAFGTDTQSQINFLKKLNPSIDFSTGAGGEILFKDPQSGKLGYLDKPAMESFKDPGELGQDILDIAYDVPAGVVQSAATAAGGLFGGLPGAVGAGAGAGYATEKLRQKIGENMMEQAPSPAALKVSTGLGALSPLLFGSGAPKTAIASKAMQRGIPQAELEASQKGLISRAYDKYAPKISSLFTKAEEPEIKWMKENLPTIKEMEKDPVKYAEKLMSDRNVLVDATNKLGSEAGKNIETAISTLDQNGVRINVDNFLKPINELKSKLVEMSKKEKVPQSLLDEISAIEAEVAQELSTKKTGLKLDPDTMILSESTTMEPIADVSPSLAKKIKDNFNRIQREYGLDLAKTGNIEGSARVGATKSSKDIAAAFGKAAGAIESEIESAAKPFRIKVGGKEKSLAEYYTENKNIYGVVQEIEDELKSTTRDTFSVDRYKNFIDRFKKPENVILRNKLEEITGKNLGDLSTEIKSFSIFSKLKDPTLRFDVPEKYGKTAISTGAGYLAGSALTGGGFAPLALSTAAGYGMSRPAVHRAGFQLGNFLQRVPSSGPSLLGTTPFGAASGAVQKQIPPYWSLLKEEENK